MMRYTRLLFVGFGLVALTACGSAPSNSAVKPTETTAVSSPASAQSSAIESGKKSESPDKAHSHGKAHDETAPHGHVDPVKVGDYTLELESHKEGSGMHLDFVIHKGEAIISDGQVTTQVQMPDGSQKSLPMKFDAQKSAYVALLEGASVGEYKVAVLSEVKGEKLNARFTLKQ